MGLVSLESYKDKHKGEKCVVMGNGPSLDMLDFTEVTCHTVGMNRGWRKLVSDYHCLMGDIA